MLCVLGSGCGDDAESQSTGGAGAAGSAESGAGGGAGAGAGSGAGALDYLPCSDDQRVGRFSLLAVAEQMAMRPIAAHTELFGHVLDGVPPADVWDELAASDDCRVLVGPQHTCDPQCGSGRTCGPDGCIPTPRTHSVGTVTITGLAQELVLTPSSVRRYSPSSVLPYPPYEEGAAIELVTEGGDYASFTLGGRGVALLEVAGGEIVVDSDQPVPLRWTAARSDDAARVFIEVDIAHHGGIAARIECDVDDDGAFEIPADLVTELVARGVAGFPTITLTRRSVDSAMIEPGCVELEVGARVIREVMVPGVTSCSNERPCPAGQTCQDADLTCL
jgi:hypothetical protein